MTDDSISIIYNSFPTILQLLLQVLERLFELTPFSLSDFNNFRLVNKTWLKESLPMYRKNVWIKINDYQSKEEISSAKSLNLKWFLKTFKSPW